MNVFVVIPAYNEEEHICKVIDDIRAVNGAWRIVVVDDASTDATAVRAREAGATVLCHAVNRGQGAALKTGTEWALLHGADIIVHFDADGQFEPQELPRCIAPLERHEAEVVLGSRFLGASPPHIPWSKRAVVLPVARIINRLITGVNLSDAHNGLRAFTRVAARAIRITQDRMAHNSNIVAEIKKNNMRFCEVPVTVYYHSYGQTPWAGFIILKDLLVGAFIR